MNVLFLSETPTAPSSMGKVVGLLASGLAEAGYRVAIAPYSVGGAFISNPYSYSFYYNPQEQAYRDGDEDFSYLPDGEVKIIPWGRNYPFQDVLSNIGWEPDILFVYSYPYLELDLNDIAFKYFTSSEKPAVIYAVHEGVSIEREQSLSILAYSLFVSPSKFVKDLFFNSLVNAFGRNGFNGVEELDNKFVVLPHPLSINYYLHKKENIINRFNSTIDECFVIGMLAKNHIRKDYYSLLKGVMQARLLGYDVCAGMYMINSVSSNYWSLNDLVRIVSNELEVSNEQLNEAIRLIPSRLSNTGLTERQIIYIYTKLMHGHLFLTRGESFGIPPLESSVLSVPTVTTAIPPQKEIFGDSIDYVDAVPRTFDNVRLYQPLYTDVLNSILNLVEGKYKQPSLDQLLRFDYRNVVRELTYIFERAFEFPSPLSSYISNSKGMVFNVESTV